MDQYNLCSTPCRFALKKIGTLKMSTINEGVHIPLLRKTHPPNQVIERTVLKTGTI